MIKTKKDILLAIIIVIIITGGILFYPRENIEDIDPIDWCVPGTNLTTGENLPIEDQNMTNEINFQVINLTTYKGKEVCQAEYSNSEEILTQYFTKKNDYIIFVYKNSSGDINEIEINQSSFKDDEDTVYENENYEEN